MDLKKYVELTGDEIAPEYEAKLKASIRRTKSQIEGMLGYSLKPKNLYTELGRVQFEGQIPLFNDPDTLLPPSEEQGSGYKLFPYNEHDRYFHVDPFTNIYAVKLVKPINDQQFITVVNLDNVVASYERDGIGKFIERHYDWFTWQWYLTYLIGYVSASEAGLMIAVDADWIDCYPDDLNYLWADMAEYQMNPNSGLASESVDGHSWSRSKEAQQKPETSSSAITTLKRYAGPFGSIFRNPTR